MRVITLCEGAGNGKNTACLLTASNMVRGEGECLDSNPTVDAFLDGFIPNTNDWMPGNLRNEIYSPFIWEINGTFTDDPDIIKQRALKAIELTYFMIESYLHINVKDITEDELLAIVNEYDDKVENNLTISDEEEDSYRFATRILKLRETYSFLEESHFVNIETYRSLGKKCSMIVNIVCGRCQIENAWRMCGRFLEEIIEIGDKRPVERVLTEDALFAALCSE